MKITEHFSKEEFEHGTIYPPEWIEDRLKVLCDNLEKIRACFGGRMLMVSSGYRSKTTNARAGGAQKSQHLAGKAADFRVLGVPMEVAYDVISYCMDQGLIDQGGLGLYPKHIHYDIRGERSRWKETSHV